jgi:hypothetical protein
MPGNYTATFDADGHSYTQSISVRLDPNVQVSLADYRARLLMALTLRNQMSTLNGMLNRLSAWQQQLNGMGNKLKQSGDSKADTGLITQAKKLNDKITGLKNDLWDPGFQHNVGEDFLKDLPHFHGELQWNGFFLGGFAQAPSAPFKAKMAELQGRLDAYLARFNQLLQQDVPAFNKAAYGDGAPTLLVGKPAVFETPQLPQS